MSFPCSSQCIGWGIPKYVVAFAGFGWVQTDLFGRCRVCHCLGLSQNRVRFSTLAFLLSVPTVNWWWLSQGRIEQEYRYVFLRGKECWRTVSKCSWIRAIQNALIPSVCEGQVTGWLWVQAAMCSPGQSCSGLDMLSALPMCQIAQAYSQRPSIQDSWCPEILDKQAVLGDAGEEKGSKMFLISFVCHEVYDCKCCATRIQGKLPGQVQWFPRLIRLFSA